MKKIAFLFIAILFSNFVWSQTLKTFSPSEVILSKPDAHSVLSFVFDEQYKLEQSALTENDVAFAQSLVLHLVDVSAVKVIANNLGQSALLTGSLKGLIIKFVKASTPSWYKNTKSDYLNSIDQKLYIDESVRTTLKRNFRSTWEIRLQSGELIY
jgi:hypothetical protein